MDFIKKAIKANCLSLQSYQNEILICLMACKIDNE